MGRFFGSRFPHAVLTGMVLLLAASPELAAKMYWTDLLNDDVSRANLDGTEVQTLVADGHVSPFAIDLDLQQLKMYWIDSRDDISQPVVRRANTDGSVVQELFSLFNAAALAVDGVNGKLYVAALGFEGPGAIFTSNLNGTGLGVLLTGLNSYDLELDLPAGKLYFLDTQGSIKRANLDGSDVEVVHETEGFATGLALDTSVGKIYWIEQDPGTIHRIDIDGANEETILTAEDIWALELDPRHDRLYYTQLTGQSILRANLDGSDIEPLVTGVTSYGLALDPQGVGNDVPAIGTAAMLALLVLMLIATSWRLLGRAPCG